MTSLYDRTVRILKLACYYDARAELRSARRTARAKASAQRRRRPGRAAAKAGKARARG